MSTNNPGARSSPQLHQHVQQQSPSSRETKFNRIHSMPKPQSAYAYNPKDSTGNVRAHMPSTREEAAMEQATENAVNSVEEINIISI